MAENDPREHCFGNPKPSCKGQCSMYCACCNEKDRRSGDSYEDRREWQRR